MTSTTLQQRTRPVIAVAATLFVADLFPWPAWVGLALAGVMAVAAAIPYLAVPGERTPTTVAPHGRT